ncbi:hypothetical protein DYB37_008378 [Aphanomyces astaci]|uniref:Uncharacterized protein n=2 Tax=Aphanomyces astaci TaxID=112090 RepID=A0A3R6XTR9_APHAT|nr:hypothetical protein DYB37_008378 [Aphanomyces astaci]
MFSLMYPAWLQQSYAPSNDAAAPITYQGFGLFAFYSTNTLNTPFYASVTTMFFADFCDGYAAGLPPPNWMLGNAAGFHEAICDTASIVSQYVMYAAAGFAALCLVAVLVMWSVWFQQKLLSIDESVALTTAGLPTLQNDTRFQLLSPGKNEDNRALAMALRQSKEAHDVELAMDESRRQHQLDQNNSPWIISQRNLSKDQHRGLDSQKRLDNLYG